EQRLVRDGRRGAASRAEDAAEVGLHGAGRRLRAGQDAAGQRRRLQRARLRTARRRPRPRAGPVDDRHGGAGRPAGAHLADRRAGGAPRRRGRHRACGGRPRDGDGPVVVRQQAGRAGRRRQSQDLLPALLVGQPRGHPGPHRPRPGRRCRRRHRDARLVVLAGPRLGQPDHPPVDRLPDDAEVRPRGGGPSDVGAALGAQRRAARPHHSQHGAARTAGARLLRRLRRVDADAAAHLGRPALAARALRRQADAQGRHARRRRTPGRRRRLRRDLGLQPRRQQPRRHTCVRARPAGDRRRGGRPGRRRHGRRGPPGERRRQGAGARGACGDDRPRLPVGPGRERPGRGRERARHPAQRPGLRAAGDRPGVGARPHPRRPAGARRLRAPAGCAGRGRHRRRGPGAEPGPGL
ncbi:MAG: Mycofactocin system heme/flavin dehydrogenase, partial [uncultured Frankineae bacterium]